MKAIIKLLEDTGEKFANRGIVLQLSDENVSDYDRGRVRGKIEMLSFLLNELTGEKLDVSKADTTKA